MSLWHHSKGNSHNVLDVKITTKGYNFGAQVAQANVLMQRDRIMGFRRHGIITSYTNPNDEEIEGMSTFASKVPTSSLASCDFLIHILLSTFYVASLNTIS